MENCFYYCYEEKMKTLKQNQLSEAAKILKEGGLIAFPTETVYGFGVIFDNKESYDRLIQVKRRPPEKPFTLMCSDIEDIDKYAEINDVAKRLINAFMPGQFTIILKAKNSLPSWAVSKEGNVGIRISSDEMVRELIRKVGKPLLVPSANRSGENPLNHDYEVKEKFENEIDALIEGSSTSTVPSTIVLIDKNITIIREGLITKKDILKVLEDK